MKKGPIANSPPLLESESSSFFSRPFPWDAQVARISKALTGGFLPRPAQRPVINALLSRRDVFAVLPTGAGKTMCFEVPALIAGGLTLIISPLVALMKDQARSLKRRGIPTAFVPGHEGEQESKWSRGRLGKAIEAQLQNPRVAPDPELAGRFGCQRTPMLMFCTPERIVSSPFLQRKIREVAAAHILSFIVVDEAHCVVAWGRGFRPVYARLRVLRSLAPRTPIAALTATATQTTERDVCGLLKMQKVVFFRASLFRPSLHLEVLRATRGLEGTLTSRYGNEIRAGRVPSCVSGPARSKKAVFSGTVLAAVILARFRGMSGIVYVSFKKQAEAIAAFLRAHRVSAAAFHGSVPAARKEAITRKWRAFGSAERDAVQVIVATSAFGMGIDNAAVRFVIRVGFPNDLSELYQQAGRAARDGASGVFLLLFTELDRQALHILNGLDAKSGRERPNWRGDMNGIHRFALDGVCRWRQILQFYGEKPPWGGALCGACDICRSRTRPKQVDISLLVWRAARAALRSPGRVTPEEAIAAALDASCMPERFAENLLEARKLQRLVDTPSVHIRDWIFFLLVEGQLFSEHIQMRRGSIKKVTLVPAALEINILRKAFVVSVWY